jgi:hypothetical protein
MRVGAAKDATKLSMASGDPAGIAAGCAHAAGAKMETINAAETANVLTMLSPTIPRCGAASGRQSYSWENAKKRHELAGLPAVRAF